MRLNLGCGRDVREGYVNVDLHKSPGVDLQCDLSILPWPFADGSADEIMMLDFLEHFPYGKTDSIIMECWRVLKPGGVLVIQVPDFDHISNAISQRPGYKCNRCGRDADGTAMCKCGQWRDDVSEAAVARLFGGQDYEGNWHFTTFNKRILSKKLESHGFGSLTFPEFNENGETYYQNWNIKVCAEKKDLW